MWRFIVKQLPDPDVTRPGSLDGAGFKIAGIAFYVIGLTNSRGPMLAIAAAGLVVLLSGIRLPRKILLPAIVVAIAGVALFYEASSTSLEIGVALSVVGILLMSRRRIPTRSSDEVDAARQAS